MIQINSLYIQYGNRILFDHCSLVVEKSEKIALIGRNGAGKSTLLKIINGDLSPDEGNIQVQKKIRIGYLKQELDNDPENKVRFEAQKAFSEVNALQDELEVLNKKLELSDYEEAELHDILDKQHHLFDRIELLGGSQIESETEKVLLGLGFSSTDLERPLKEFSGGWQMRVELAKLLLSKPDVLLLDEPTNHLDIESIIWLEKYLKSYFGNIILISHDTHFLNEVCEKTVEIDSGSFYEYKATYYEYVTLKQERIAIQESAFKNQQKQIEQKERTIKRFMAKANKTKMAQSMQKQLDKVERITIDSFDERDMKLRFPDPPRSGRTAVLAKCSKRYGDLKVLENIHFELERGEKIAFVGQNGQGKSTLAKMIVGDVAPSKGEVSLGTNVGIGYYAQDQTDALDMGISLLESMENVSSAEQRPNIRKILGNFLFSGEDVDKKVSVLSGGERARLALAIMCLRSFNLLIMDEPTNHLDIRAKMVLKQAIQNYDGSCIIVSHDRDFLSGLTDKTIEFKDNKINTYLGDINYFLERREMENIREYEMGLPEKSESQKKTGGKTHQFSRDEIKQKKRKVQYLERDIEKLEKEIELIHNMMMDPDFYKDPVYVETSIKMNKLQNELEGKMENWESLLSELEGIE